MGRFFGRQNIFAFDQSNLLGKFIDYQYEGIVPICNKRKNKYKIERKRKKKY